MSAVRFDPLTVKLCEVDGEPAHPEKEVIVDVMSTLG